MSLGKCLFTAVTALAATASVSWAQSPCNTPLYPMGPVLKDLSRDISVLATDSEDPRFPTKVYWFQCANAAGLTTMTRHVVNQQVVINACQILEGCDELPNAGIRFVGLMSSWQRFSDPFSNPVKNARIGWEEVKKGDVLDCTVTPPVKIGTWNSLGTIGTNPSRKGVSVGCGECFRCGLHTGTIRATIQVPGKPPAMLVAVYQYDTVPDPAVDCDTINPCLPAFEGRGNLDGVHMSRCSG